MENPEHFEREIANRKLYRAASQERASVRALRSWQFLLGTSSTPINCRTPALISDKAGFIRDCLIFSYASARCNSMIQCSAEQTNKQQGNSTSHRRPSLAHMPHSPRASRLSPPAPPRPRPRPRLETTRRPGLGCARCTHTREDKESPLSWQGMTYEK